MINKSSQQMKNILFSILFIAGLYSCHNSKKLLNSGNYDLAIDAATRKLIRDKDKESQILVLEEAFKKDAERDNARINFLRQEGRPDNWNEIYLIYTHITKRQNAIRPLLP